MNNSERRKRGRPKSNGQCAAWRFCRDLLLVWLYNQIRKREPKHEAALAETVREFRNLHLETRASVTEVKRSLARYQPQGAQIAWQIVPTPEAETTRLIDICRQVERFVTLFLEKSGKILGTASPEMARLIETCRQLAQLESLLSNQPKLMLDFGFGPRPLHPRASTDAVNRAARVTAVIQRHSCLSSSSSGPTLPLGAVGSEYFGLKTQ